MNKKHYLTVLILIIIILTGCGARVSQTLDVDYNFKGVREIVIEIDSSDLENIEGGEPALTSVLEENKPEVLSIEKKFEGENVIYYFSYEFDGLEEYISKTESIIGRSFNAELISDLSEENPFLVGIKYEEDNIEDEIIQWAIDAVEKAEITSSSASEFIDNNEVSILFNDDKISQYSSDEKHQYESVNKLSAQEIKFDLDLNNDVYKIELIFNSGTNEIFNYEAIESFFNQKAPTKKVNNDETINFIMDFDSYSKFSNFINSLGNSFIKLENKMENPINKSYDIYLKILPWELVDDLTTIDKSIMVINMKNGFNSPNAKYYCLHEIIEEENDYLIIESAGMIDFEYSYQKKLVLDNLKVIKTIDNYNKVDNFIEAKVNSSSLETFDIDEISEYFKNQGYDISIDDDGQTAILNIKNNISIGETTNNRMAIQSLYKTYKSNLFEDNYIHYFELYNFEEFIPANEYEILIKINKSLKPIKLNNNLDYFDKDSLDRLLVGKYYEYEGKLFNKGKIEVIIEGKNYFGYIIVGIVITIVIILIIILVLQSKKRKEPKILEN